MRWVFVLFLLFVGACTSRSGYEDPRVLTRDFAMVVLFEPSRCADFLSKAGAIKVSSAGEAYSPMDKDKAKLACQTLEGYQKLYGKPIDIKPQVDTKYSEDRILMSANLYFQRGEPTPMKVFVVKIKNRWYVVP